MTAPTYNDYQGRPPRAASLHRQINEIRNPPLPPLSDPGSNETIGGWLKAWGLAKPLLSGLVVVMLWTVHTLYSSGWLNTAVKSTELIAVTTDQKFKDQELKAAIDTLSHKAEAHDRILERLATYSGEMRTDLATIKGYMAGLTQRQPGAQTSSPFGVTPAGGSWGAHTSDQRD